MNAIETKGIKLNNMLLDNQANVSIMHPSLFHSIKPANMDIRVNGVGRVQLTADSTGYLQDFSRVYASANTVLTWRIHTR